MTAHATSRASVTKRERVNARADGQSSLRRVAAIAVGRLVKTAAQLKKRSGGTAVPGLVANRIDPKLLSTCLAQFPSGTIVVTGSCGKSTTTKMLSALLEAHGLSTFSNASTANIAQGLMSALLDHISWTGKTSAEIAVIEMDEAHAARLAAMAPPRLTVLTNVATDQIDRFPEPSHVAHLLAKAASSATQGVVVNADDGLLAHALATQSVVPLESFGAARDAVAHHPHGLGTVGGSNLEGGTRVVATRGLTATIDHNGTELEIKLPSRGGHYAMDAAAAISAAHAVLGRGFDPDLVVRTLGALKPVFGRGEVVTIGGKMIEFLLVQNPTSLQLTVDLLPPDTEQLLVAIGTDVRDSSYLWPVDLTTLPPVQCVTGSRANDFALQLVYSGVPVGAVQPNLPAALDAFIALPEPSSGVKTVMCSADSLRKSRLHWGLA